MLMHSEFLLLKIYFHNHVNSFHVSVVGTTWISLYCLLFKSYMGFLKTVYLL